MTLREGLGLVLLIGGVMLAPFSHWLHLKWLVVALALVVCGAALFFSARLARRMARSPSDAASGTIDLPAVGAARGFPGRRAFSESGEDD